MANRKIGLSYYSIDTDYFQDIKIKRLKKDFGCNGYAVYMYILNEIYRVKGCYLPWDESTAFDVAEYWGIKESLVKEVVSYCCAVGLFSKELLTSGRVLTSRSVQSRYTDMCRRAKRTGVIIPEAYDILPEEIPVPPEKAPYPTESCPKEKKSTNTPFTIPPRKKRVVQSGEIPVETFGEIIEAENTPEGRSRKALGCSSEKYAALIREYVLEQSAKGNTRNYEREYRSHFISWAKIKIGKENENEPGRKHYARLD